MPEPNYNFLIVSDLHLSEGLRPEAGKWSVNEDFLSDDGFATFLHYHEERRKSGLPWRLIIAGDGFDFLQVTTPSTINAEDLLDKISEFNDLKGRELRKIANPQRRQTQAVDRLHRVIRMMEEKPVNNHPALGQCAEELLHKAQDIEEGFVWALEQLINEIWILANKPEAELKATDIEFGLGTSWPEAIWKVDRIAEGHPVFFSSLAWFIDRGNTVVMLKGNHDVELHWKEVQGRLRQQVADAHINLQLPDPPWTGGVPHPMLSAEAFEDEIRNGLSFCPWIYFEPGWFYLEHGNQYYATDAFDDFLNPLLPENPHLIRLPSGSFFVRYFFNKVEQTFSYIDNLRPLTRSIAWIFENRFFDSVGLLVKYFGGLWQFVEVFTSRSRSDIREDKGILRAREMIDKTGGYDHKEAMKSRTRTDKEVDEEIKRIHKTIGPRGRYGRRGAKHYQVKAIIQGDNAHERGLRETVQEPLTREYLQEIEKNARTGRTRGIRRFYAISSLVLPMILAILILLGLVAVFGIPVMLLTMAQQAKTLISEYYMLWFALSGVVLFIVKQALARWIRKKVENIDPLLDSAKKVWKILQRSHGSEETPTVKYLVFGHNHDPNSCRIDFDGTPCWYVNTGSWVHSVDEIESWDRLELDFTFLKIVPAMNTRAPQLLRWNQAKGFPERIRRRMDPKVSGISCYREKESPQIGERSDGE